MARSARRCTSSSSDTRRTRSQRSRTPTDRYQTRTAKPCNNRCTMSCRTRIRRLHCNAVLTRRDPRSNDLHIRRRRRTLDPSSSACMQPRPVRGSQAPSASRTMPRRWLARRGTTLSARNVSPGTSHLAWPMPDPGRPGPTSVSQPSLYRPAPVRATPTPPAAPTTSSRTSCRSRRA
jgi:hypothetical protein